MYCGGAPARGAASAVADAVEFRNGGCDGRERGRAKYIRMETDISAFIRNIDVRFQE
jgi:hypothetical protein